MKTIAKAAVGTLLAAGAVMAPLSMEAAAAPLPTVKTVAPAVHLGTHAHASSHRAYTHHRTGDLWRYCTNNRNDYWRYGHRVDCRYHSWDWNRYGNHNHRDCVLYWRR